MAKDDTGDSHKTLMPFVVYQNNLEMFGRMVQSTCALSLSILEATRRHNSQLSEALAQETPAQAFAEGMIPTTDEMDRAAAIVASAMNDAASRALASAAADASTADKAEKVQTPPAATIAAKKAPLKATPKKPAARKSTSAASPKA